MDSQVKLRSYESGYRRAAVLVIPLLMLRATLEADHDKALCTVPFSCSSVGDSTMPSARDYLNGVVAKMERHGNQNRLFILM